MYNMLMQPGSVINPGQNSNLQPDPPVQEPNQVLDQPAPPPTAAAPAYSSPPSSPAPELGQPLQNNANSDDILYWQAADFVSHDKPATWYVVLTFGVVIVAGLLYLLTRDIVTTVSVVFIAVVFAIVAAMKPKTIEYSLDLYGITAGQKRYEFAQFKSFGLIEENGSTNISLLPLKRLIPYVVVSLDPKNAQQVIDAISQNLPYEERKESSLDSFMHRLRF